MYYVDAGTHNPDHRLGGELEFLDPRAGIEAVTIPDDRLRPEAGLLVIFPSYSYLWVHPYACRTSLVFGQFGNSHEYAGGAGC